MVFWGGKKDSEDSVKSLRILFASTLFFSLLKICVRPLPSRASKSRLEVLSCEDVFSFEFL